MPSPVIERGKKGCFKSQTQILLRESPFLILDILPLHNDSEFVFSLYND